MIVLATRRLVADAKRRCRQSRLLGSIIRDARIRYPYPWNEADRARYVTERYFIESFDWRQAVDLMRKNRKEGGR